LGKERDDLIKMDPYFIKSTVPKGSYPGMTQDVETVASPAYLICLESLKTDDVYRITKAIFDNLKDIAASHKQGENVKLETALIGSTIPLHPGAEKFYKEKGLVK
jgi:TRAP transporter TAXI family solute receptor